MLYCGQAAAFLGDGHASLVRDDENYNIEHVIQTTNNSKELHPRRNVSVSSYRAAAVTKPEANATVQSFNDQRAPSSGDGDRTHNGSIANRIALHQTAETFNQQTSSHTGKSFDQEVSAWWFRGIMMSNPLFEAAKLTANNSQKVKKAIRAKNYESILDAMIGLGKYADKMGSNTAMQSAWKSVQKSVLYLLQNAPEIEILNSFEIVTQTLPHLWANVAGLVKSLGGGKMTAIIMFEGLARSLSEQTEFSHYFLVKFNGLSKILDCGLSRL